MVRTRWVPPGNGQAREEAWRQLGIHLRPSLSPSIILLFCFIFFPVLVTVWNRFLLALYLPLPTGALRELKQRCWLAETTSNLMLPLGPVLRGSGSLLCCGFSLISLISDEALSSFLQGQAAWGPCRQPACGCLSPASVPGSLSTELTEVVGPLYSIPEKALWPGRAHESVPWGLGYRLARSTHGTLRWAAFHNVTFQPTESQLWPSPEFSAT